MYQSLLDKNMLPVNISKFHLKGIYNLQIKRMIEIFFKRAGTAVIKVPKGNDTKT